MKFIKRDDFQRKKKQSLLVQFDFLKDLPNLYNDKDMLDEPMHAIK
jgi:hypothetical protein